MQLTNLQLELLKTFSYDLNESQILEIKELLAKYFAQKATSEMDGFWDENNWTDETIEKLAEEHLRTEYK
ncbi:MAG: hypothetical protein WA584_07040 [Pyrinomonadaceae bacterium]